MAIATDKVAVINAVDALATFNVRFTIELFPCDVVKFLELFLVNGSSEVVRVGCYWEGHLVKRSIASQSAISLVLAANGEGKLLSLVHFGFNLVIRGSLERGLEDLLPLLLLLLGDDAGFGSRSRRCRNGFWRRRDGLASEGGVGGSSARRGSACQRSSLAKLRGSGFGRLHLTDLSLRPSQRSESMRHSCINVTR